MVLTMASILAVLLLVSFLSFLAKHFPTGWWYVRLIQRTNGIRHCRRAGYEWYCGINSKSRLYLKEEVIKVVVTFADKIINVLRVPILTAAASLLAFYKVELHGLF